ncbi:fumarylacetoacetate hydrolase family protein [Sediminispirochaeta smaragdinae]|jgi:2-keto-4-pentenoate hydratase/2-oxohepta-3-ene-1,7-dioic acid hydratase in catechol pathway|uniref:Ureidoglycolate lyase n=1 Tax=Sediminispirochaeta smaragdinae (strain DSM 11293 / JCM 15392 / SEBR 4228) TaxID=573413 RepID=E1RAA8_SEDSS|nr:fumarylacetoacetate hydrolase family protein [Sediminispirochaeta smaragdinae]ADK79399.1 Ureidoglycolate lyase [Sediminispirochaeta smaragdinae DSM 11293]
MVVLPVKGRDESYQVRPSKIVALGLNYHEHVKESVFLTTRKIPLDIPSEPVLFPKTPNVLIGDGEAIVIPAYLQGYDFEEVRVDYEAELGFFVGKRCKDVPEEKAMDYILGYTCFNDVSQRNFQTEDKSGWFRGKSLDTFGPVGPVVVPASDIPDPQNLHIECRLNGKVVQSGNTSQMIFPIPTIVAFISRHFTLEEGDLIITGTPKGVGRIHHGDVVEVEIEGIGTLRNPVREEGR